MTNFADARTCKYRPRLKSAQIKSPRLRPPRPLSVSFGIADWFLSSFFPCDNISPPLKNFLFRTGSQWGAKWADNPTFMQPPTRTSVPGGDPATVNPVGRWCGLEGTIVDFLKHGARPDQVGLSRIFVVSEIEIPNMLVNLVQSG